MSSSGSDDGESGDDSSESSSDEEIDDISVMLRRVKENSFLTTTLHVGDEHSEWVQNNMTDEEWEELGRDVSNNCCLEELDINDTLSDQRMTFFFRGLIRSTSVKNVDLMYNGFGFEGVRSMLPFLQNTNNLRELNVTGNNIASEGFKLLWGALRDSSIKELWCASCGLDSIEIDSEGIPPNLRLLWFEKNNINADGCREVAKLLQGSSTLKNLSLRNNNIDDVGVAILVNALQSNRTLRKLDLGKNEGISVEGASSCLRLVNNISSTNATLQSNHTLQKLKVKRIQYDVLGTDVNSEIQAQINCAVAINVNYKKDPEAAGKIKVVRTQLHSETRAELANLQGVDRSLYSDINALHLPEVLALVGQHHGQGELYVALKSSIVTLFSTVNRKKFIQQQRDYHVTKAEQLNAELAAIEVAEGDAVEIERQSRSNKRRRKWWWGLWVGGA
jgi:hypothetical protein